ncbi:MAG: PhzF family phenazine biosynthesis protein [Clostridiales bacterium]|nr:PhzF family phenazine biosynthesis protein [Clostridiales bacterium]
MKFYIVDAFTDEIFGGNPAGVVILPEGADFPTDEICVKTAKELRYSETAFIKRLNDREFNIRYFTPAAEVELCGHATIGSFAALRYGGYIGDGEFMNHTISGDLNIGVDGERVLMDMAVPVKINEISEEDKLVELYKIMGLDYLDQKARGLKLIPQMISTGLPDIMMPVLTEADLDAIEPDFKALYDLSARYEVVGVHAFTLDGDDATCHVRNFAPLYDIDEEAATGTSNGALTYYGYLNGFVKSGDNCKFIQGEKMQRPSAIESHIEADENGCLIRVGGRGIMVAEGEINI